MSSNGDAGGSLPASKKTKTEESGQNVGGVTMPPQGVNVGGVTMPPQGVNVGGVTMPPQGVNVGGVTMPPAGDNVGGVTMPPAGTNVGGVTMPPAGTNVGGVTMPPAGTNVGGVTMPPQGTVNTNTAAAPIVGVTMPPEWHRHSKMRAKGKLKNEEDKPVHPDDAIILAKISDPIERLKVARRLRKRRKKLYRDRDFGNSAMQRGRSLKYLGQGRHTSRTDLSANDTLTQLEAARNRVLPGAVIPDDVKRKLELQRAREEAAQTQLELQAAGIVPTEAADDDDLKVGSIDPVTGKELDINDIELRKIRAQQQRLKPLLEKEKKHKQTGGRSYERFADKRDDPDRLTWDEFKQLHQKDMDFGQKKEMGEYRKRLDEEREEKLRASRLARKQSKKELKAKRKKLLAKRKRKRQAGGKDGSSDEADVGAGALSAFLNASDSDSDSD